MPTATQTINEASAATVEGKKLTAKELGALADAWHEQRTKRLDADKVAAAHKVLETLAQTTIIAQLQNQAITAIGGKTVRVSISNEPDFQPHVTDWDKFYAYIHKKKAWDLLERRPGKLACRARWDDNVEVPGVEKFPVYKLYSSKVI